MAAQFNIHFNVSEDELQGKRLLVFLKPQNPQRDDQIHAWQVLEGAAGATVSFAYADSIATDVSSVGRQGAAIVSRREPIVPGQLLRAVSPDGQSTVLQPAPTSLAQMKLTPQQCGVINQTYPFTQLDSNWYVNDRPVVTMPHVDMNRMVTFEYLPNFFFMLATPPMAGQTYLVRNFSDMTQYVMPETATEVHVAVNREHGLWRFDFSAS